MVFYVFQANRIYDVRYRLVLSPNSESLPGKA